MRVDVLCTGIRLAPVWLLLASHCASGHWPTDEECKQHVMQYGFCVDGFQECPWTLVTQMFVHISSQHLLSNIFSLCSTLMEFGGNSMKANVEEDDPEKATALAVGSLTVMTVGGAVGGIGGQVIYNDSRIVRTVKDESLPRKIIAKIKDSSLATNINGTSSSSTSGSSGPTYGSAGAATSESLWSTIKRNAEQWHLNARANIQERINASMMMCGASAGVCALAGFNVTYYRRPITAMTLVMPEVMVLMQLLCAPRETKGWRTLMPGEMVGHAAHVGGFVAGCVLGLIWGSWQRSYRAKKESTATKKKTKKNERYW